MISIGNTLDGKYVIVGRLGAGGFGEVFLAEDQAIPGRQLALKVLARHSAGNHEDLVWEMRALSQFQHPGVVGFLHHFTHESLLVLVMEFCAGGSLGDRLHAARRVKQDEALRWSAVLCDTLAFVHGKGIVHHDIKPANILFAQDGVVKIGDFGVANRDAGTERYMSPESLLGEIVTKTDPRVDVYALGVTLLEVLSGKHPFAGMAPEEALKSRISHDFVPDDLPRWVQEIVLRATHPTPELRFQSMAEFAEAIRARHVPYVLDSKLIKAHALAEKSEAQLDRKKWKTAETLANRALHVSPDCANALMAAGRCQLLLRRIDKAKALFDRALAVNPRIHVQKELGWLNLEQGHLPVAISLLSDHLDRNASDFEAFNLLLKCFYLSERYEAGEELARLMMDEKTANSCFRNNRFVCRLLNGGYTEAALTKIDARTLKSPFTTYNLAVAREEPRSWDAGGARPLRGKLLFQEYRFDVARNSAKRNRLRFQLKNGDRQETTAAVVCIGSLAANDIVVSDASVSRRHAVLINLPDEVWVYDLNSTVGTRRDSEPVSGRAFLDGVHSLTVGRVEMDVAARADLLV